MSLKKFEERRLMMQKKHEEDLARLQEEEQKERQKRVAPLVSRYSTLFEDVLTKMLNDRVEDLDKATFRKTQVRQRIEAMLVEEMAALIGADSDPENADIESEDSTEATILSARDDSQERPGAGFFEEPSMDAARSPNLGAV